MKKKYDTLLLTLTTLCLISARLKRRHWENCSMILALSLMLKSRQAINRTTRVFGKNSKVGSITRKQLLATRFPTFSKYFSLDVDADVLTPKYMNYLSMGHEEVCGARQLLTSLKNSEHKLYVVSNGNLDVQNRRLRDSGFGDYFEQIFISEKMGVKNRIRNF